MAEKLRSLPRAEVEKRLRRLSPEQCLALKFDWRFWARPKQLPPSGRPWTTWVVRAGRGFGKTRTGAEWVREKVERAEAGRIALVGATAADVRDVMVEGESGILRTAPPWNRPKFEPAKRRITWGNGAQAALYSADEPDRLRGPQHDLAWSDELAAWRFLKDAWDNLQFGLRLGENPQQCVTTTPKPLKILKEIEADPNTIVTIGASYENRVNLAPVFFSAIVKKYEGTRLGRQELNAEILEDNPGALWTRARIERDRVALKDVPELQRTVVAGDPAVTSREDSDETGIITAGVAMVQGQLHGYVLRDSSMIDSPDKWAKQIVLDYHSLKADRVIGEVNNGGDLIETILRTVDPNVSYKDVHASKGKYARAEPVAALSEQGRLHHVGSFPILEDQLCDYDPLVAKWSPDRLDALVWAITELMLVDNDGAILEYLRGDRKAQEAQAKREAEADQKLRGGGK